MDCLTELYLVKKHILMVENIKDGMTEIKEIFADFKSKHTTPTTEIELLAQIGELRDIFRKMIDDEQYEEWFHGDYEMYTDKFHHRSYWNEIPNDVVTDYLFEQFVNLLEITESDASQYSVSLYDFNDEYIYFENEDDMNSFIYNYDCAPYTVFEKDGDEYIESYSV